MIISCIYFVMIRLIVITEVDIDIAYEKHSNYFWQRKLQSCTEYSYIEENWLIIPHWWRIILTVKMKVPSSSSSKLPYRLTQNIMLVRFCRWALFLWWNSSRKPKNCNHGIKQYVSHKRLHYSCIEIIISLACLSTSKNTPQQKTSNTF